MLRPNITVGSRLPGDVLDPTSLQLSSVLNPGIFVIAGELVLLLLNAITIITSAHIALTSPYLRTVHLLGIQVKDNIDVAEDTFNCSSSEAYTINQTLVMLVALFPFSLVPLQLSVGSLVCAIILDDNKSTDSRAIYPLITTYSPLVSPAPSCTLCDRANVKRNTFGMRASQASHNAVRSIVKICWMFPPVMAVTSATTIHGRGRLRR